jgi:hypothetical protein
MGILKTAAKVGVASAVHGRVQRRQQMRWAAEDQRVEAAAPPPPPPPSAPTPGHAPAPPPAADSGERLAQLKLLGELKDSGVLTEFEFESEKRKLLGL